MEKKGTFVALFQIVFILILLRMRYVIIFLYVLLLAPFSHAQTEKKGQILVVTSYNPDTKRVEELIANLTNKLNENGFEHSLLVESLNISSISNCAMWSSKLNLILERYRKTKLVAIVLVGQELWSASISGGVMLEGIPVFVVNASRNGVILTDFATDSDDNSVNESVNMEELAVKKHNQFGGRLYNYDVDSNIKLIQRLFPSVHEIAFFSDNTYGGVSLKAFMEASEGRYPDLTFKYIDAKFGETKAISSVKELSSETSAILLGTWRVDGKNRHMMHNSLVDILSHNKLVPVVSLTGVGIGEAAIGGYIPKYAENGSEIARRIVNLYVHRDTSKIKFTLLDNHYKFNKELLLKYNIEDHWLPQDALIYSSVDNKLQKYKYYIRIIIGIICFLFIVLIFIILILRRNIMLKHNLQRRETELIIARDNAQESDRLKSSFLANMSHEIRTPLNAIVGFSSIISEQEGLSEDNKECQKIISANSEILLALINDILDLSRLEFGNVKFDMTDVDVRELCRNAMASFSCLMSDNVEGILSMPDENCIIYADQRRVMQVLNNLMGNANKFTVSGYIKLSYSIDKGENRVYFSVEDTGCGVPLDKHESVFHRFVKIDDFKQGAGLGLSICKNILSRFDSEMWIDSSYTQGARFVFSYEIKEIVQS